MSETPALDALETYRGPRKQVSVRISSDALLVLELAAAAYGVSRHALLTRLVEGCAAELEETAKTGAGL